MARVQSPVSIFSPSRQKCLIHNYRLRRFFLSAPWWHIARGGGGVEVWLCWFIWNLALDSGKWSALFSGRFAFWEDTCGPCWIRLNGPQGCVWPEFEIHTPVSQGPSSNWTSVTRYLDKERRNAMNNRLLFYFINTAVYNNHLSKPVIF